MRIPVHSPWLPGYIDVVTKTILIILTMAGLFLDRSHMYHFYAISNQMKIYIMMPYFLDCSYVSALININYTQNFDSSTHDLIP